MWLCYSYSFIDTLKLKKMNVDKPHKCEKCDKSYKQKRDLTKHVKTHDPGAKFEHWCRECLREFSTKWGLTSH